jgi:hypothetical protein
MDLLVREELEISTVEWLKIKVIKQGCHST